MDISNSTDDISNEFRQRLDSIYDFAIKKIHWNNGFSKNALADALGITRTKLNAWDGGQLPHPDDLESMIRLLGLSSVWAMAGCGNIEGRDIPNDAPRAEWKRQFPVVYQAWKRKAADERKTISLTSMGRDLGLSYGKVQAWERGQRPSLADLYMLSKTLGLHPDWLLLGMGDPRKGLGPDPKNGNMQFNPKAMANVSHLLQPESETGKTKPIPPAHPCTPHDRIPVQGLAPCSVQGWDTGRRMAFDVERLTGLGPRAFAALPIGTSMEPEGIREGMVCYCDPDRTPEQGDAVYIEADGNATIKLWGGESPERAGMVRLTGWLPERNGKQIFHLDVDRKSITVIAPVVYVKRRA